MRHHQFFTIDLEAYVTHRDDLSVQLSSEVKELPWRAVVRGGRQMDWQWFATEQEAVAWIETWKRPLEPVEKLK